MIWYSALLCACVICAGAARRVLVVFPSPERSHGALGDAVVETLLAGGHQVTYVSVYPKNTSNANLTYIDISSVLTQQSVKEQYNNRMLYSRPPVHVTLKSGPLHAQNALRHEAVRELLHDPSVTFDAIVAHWLYSGLLAPLSSLFECPLIWYVHGDSSWLSQRLMHEQPSAAYSTDLLSGYASPPPLSVKDRAWGLVLQGYYYVWLYYIEHFIELPAYEAIYRTPLQLRGRTLPRYEDAMYNGSLLLINVHPPLGQSLPLPMNAKLVGGHHILEPVKPLTKSLKELMDNAKNGVIFVNLDNLQGRLPNQMKTQMLDALSQLNRLVLWQMEDPVDQSSLIEAVHCGVPFVAVPRLGEHLVNVDLLVAKGLGQKVEFNTYLPWTLEGAIREVLRDSSFRTNMQQASAVFQHRVQPASSELLYWVELVTSTAGPAYLRSPAVVTPALERYYVDLWVLAAMILWFLSKVVKVVQVHLKDLEKKNK